MLLYVLSSHRWHADIKPDNVLYVNGQFKLADPGFAIFVDKKDGLEPEALFKGGTETYGGSSPTCE